MSTEMSMSAETTLGPILRKLESHAQLSTADRNAFLALPFTRRSFGAGSHIIREGDRATTCCGVISGFAFRYKTVADGGRQIVSVHIPGDFCDLQNAPFGAAVHSLQMMTAGELVTVPTSAIEELALSRPELQKVLWTDTLVDASIFAEWMVNIGRRDARARIAHLLCELALRLRTAGLIEGNSFALPMTQEHIADVTGMTSVHVNRTLQDLRRAGVICSDRRSLTIEDWESLASIGDFDATYLNPGHSRSAQFPRAQAIHQTIGA